MSRISTLNINKLNLLRNVVLKRPSYRHYYPRTLDLLGAHFDKELMALQNMTYTPLSFLGQWFGQFRWVSILKCRRLLTLERKIFILHPFLERLSASNYYNSTLKDLLPMKYFEEKLYLYEAKLKKYQHSSGRLNFSGGNCIRFFVLPPLTAVLFWKIFKVSIYRCCYLFRWKATFLLLGLSLTRKSLLLDLEVFKFSFLSLSISL